MASHTCPRCKRTSAHPEDRKWSWCAACEVFAWETSPQPVALDLVIAAFHRRLRGQIASGSPFSLQFEQFVDDGVAYWRAFIKMGQVVWKCSTRQHHSPTEALRELSEIVDGLGDRRFA